MLENINLEKKLSREEYKRMLPSLQMRLYELEKACWDNGVPSVIVFEGWDASGKGSAISALSQRLDPRGFRLHSSQAPRTFEQHYPWLWRFWLKVPSRGEMLIFDHSWYGRMLGERVYGTITEKEWRRAGRDILDFERMLADDGASMLKFFFHIGKKEQKKRFKAMEADPLESWRLSKDDWERHKKYDEYVDAIEEMFEQTDTEFAPWVIVEATSTPFACRKVFETVIAALERRLGAKAPPKTEAGESTMQDADLREVMESLEGNDARDTRSNSQA
jgi:polyphosphate kinase 2 (PPK2 family)